MDRYERTDVLEIPTTWEEVKKYDEFCKRICINNNIYTLYVPNEFDRIHTYITIYKNKYSKGGTCIVNEAAHYKLSAQGYRKAIIKFIKLFNGEEK